MNDPGVRVDIYSQQAPSITTYQVPGPGKLVSRTSSAFLDAQDVDMITTAVWSPGASAPQPQPSSSATQAPVPTTTVVTPEPSTPAGPTVPAYGQCGGQVTLLFQIFKRVLAHSVLTILGLDWSNAMCRGDTVPED